MSTSLSYLAERDKPVGSWSLIESVDQDLATPLWLSHDGKRVGYARALRCRSLRTSERVERVVEQAKAIEHEGIVPLLDLPVLEGGGGFVAVSDYEEGQPLASLLSKANLARKPVPLPVAASIAIDLLDALYAAGGKLAPAWARGGLRPDCVLITRGGRARIMELGASAVLAGVDPLASDPRWAAYASPEHLETGQPSPTSDVFTVATLLSEAFANRPLFGGRDIHEVKQKLLVDDIPRADRRAKGRVPQPLADAISRALDREPGDRFATAKEFAEVIRRTCGAVAERLEVSAYVEQLHLVALNNRRRALEKAMGRPAPVSIPPRAGGKPSHPPHRVTVGTPRLPRLGGSTPPPAAATAAPGKAAAAKRAKLKYAPRTSRQAQRKSAAPAPYKPKLGVATPVRGSIPPPRPDGASLKPSPRAQPTDGDQAPPDAARLSDSSAPPEPPPSSGGAATAEPPPSSAPPAEVAASPSSDGAPASAPASEPKRSDPAPSSSGIEVVVGPASDAGQSEPAPSSSGIEVVAGPVSDAGQSEPAPSSSGIEVVVGPASDAGQSEPAPSSSGIEVVVGPASDAGQAGPAPSSSGIEVVVAPPSEAGLPADEAPASGPPASEEPAEGQGEEDEWAAAIRAAKADADGKPSAPSPSRPQPSDPSPSQPEAQPAPSERPAAPAKAVPATEPEDVVDEPSLGDVTTGSSRRLPYVLLGMVLGAAAAIGAVVGVPSLRSALSLPASASCAPCEPPPPPAPPTETTAAPEDGEDDESSAPDASASASADAEQEPAPPPRPKGKLPRRPPPRPKAEPDPPPAPPPPAAPPPADPDVYE